MINFLFKFSLKISDFIRNFYQNKYLNYKYSKLLNYFYSLHICSIRNTVNLLINSNNSLSRFGDGELRWAINAKDVPGFERNSLQLRKRLKEVLMCNKDELMIGLPDYFNTHNKFTNGASSFWKQFCVKYTDDFKSLLYQNKQYYNTSASRPYMDYNTRQIADDTFDLWKQVWKNKNILIVEGSESHLGVGNDLFKSASDIKRIECPYKNAFESYNKILHYVTIFLSNHSSYMAVLSLGPTATVLSYDLCNKGFRAIDVGHIDVEYEWYLIGAKEKIDLPHRYVNELQDGRYSLPINNVNYKKQIVMHIH